ncbi:MAG TPA: response regulator [Planctomycetes bacterium]|nr:response regulator [Planctomycetota bacterium]
MDIKHTNVLLVEDDPAAGRLIRRILSKAGQNFRCSLRTAPTVSKALEQLRKRRFDNVLLDLGISGSKGLERVDRIRTTSPDVPIIVLTTTTDKDVQVEAIKRGADDYFIKPKVFCESLGEHIQYVIQRKKAIESLRRNCEHFRAIIENAPCAVVCISPEGHIQEFNACARRLWNKDIREVAGKSFLQTCVERGERFNVYVNLRKVLCGESVRSVSTTITNPDGASESLCWDFGPIRAKDGPISSVIAVVRRQKPAELQYDNGLSALRLAFNPRFDDAVENILASLSAILEKTEKLNSRANRATVKQSADNMQSAYCSEEQIPPHKSAAIERLVLSLITGRQDTKTT